jgi:hypothetical protein
MTPTSPTPGRAGSPGPRCRSYTRTLVKAAAPLFGCFHGQEVCAACLLAILQMAVEATLL